MFTHKRILIKALTILKILPEKERSLTYEVMGAEYLRKNNN